MKYRTANTILYCKEWQATVDFYRKTLALEVNFSNEWFVEFCLSDTARLSIANEARASIKSAHGAGLTLGFQVENLAELETMHTHLTQSGHHPTPIKAVWGSRAFYVDDPEGNRIEFWS